MYLCERRRFAEKQWKRGNEARYKKNDSADCTNETSYEYFHFKRVWNNVYLAQL